jgi:ribosomal-protein-alanine N-acetyltransferase
MNPYPPDAFVLEGQPGVRIRAMQHADLERVHAIDKLSFSMPWPASAFRYELVENTNSQLWVAELAGDEGEPQVIGAVVTWLILDEAHIATLAVHPDQRNRGIGSLLVATTLREAIHAGARMATLEVRVGNVEARRLYHHFKFEIVGRRPSYYQDTHEDALLMTVQLEDGESYLQWLESGAWQAPLPEAEHTSAGGSHTGG